MMRSFLLLLSSLLSVSCGALESDVKQHKAPPVILKASIDQSLILPYQQLKLHLIGENKGRVNTTFNDPYTVPNAMALTLVSNARTESTLVSTARNDAPNNIALLPRKVSISPAKPFRFSIDLQKYFQLSRPGNYALSINYEWQDGKVWQSPEYHFEISSTSVSYLAGTANESGQTGYHGVYWLNQSKSGSTLLVKPWRIQDHDFTLGGANAYFGVPSNTDISLSMQPAHDPMLDRWLVTLSKTSLAARYLSDQKELELTTSTEVPESLSLIKPALASLSPDEGRPDVTIGLIEKYSQRSSLHLVEISSNGDIKKQPAMDLPFYVDKSWALSDRTGIKKYFFTTHVGNASQLKKVTCRPNKSCTPAETILETEAMVMVGDIRLSNSETVIFTGLFSQQSKWFRRVYSQVDNQSLSLAYQDALETLGASPVAKAVKLDSKGKIHSLYQNEDGLHYVAHTQQRSQWTLANKFFVENQFELILLENNKSKILYIDPLRGLVSEELGK